MTRADIEEFFKTLLLGDFEEHQNTAAQIVGGLIALIPILGQVMAGRDITGTLFNINKRGGFKNAAPEQLVNLGFAAFGAIPELGPAFKTVFKPLWKERQLAKGAVHSGMAAIEALLGLGKGGAVTWIRKELIGKWAARTQQMIAATLAALDLCIELMDFIATASGWKDWLIPDSIQNLAKEMLPGLKKMRGQITEPLTRASEEIRQFLEDLLGERAAAVVMAVGGTAVAASAIPATRTRAGHNAAETHPTGKVPARQPEVHVKTAPKADAAKGAGSVHSAMQVTIKSFRDLAKTETGLVGEHMADYHELKRFSDELKALGHQPQWPSGNWPHDKTDAKCGTAPIKKLNADKRPVNLGQIDLKKVTHQGINAVWEHGGHYTATEAKARASEFAVAATVKSLNDRGLLPAPAQALSATLQMLWVLLAVTNDKTGQSAPLVQMSDEWVRKRADGEQVGAATRSLQNGSAARRVLLVTFESGGSPAHGQALLDILRGKPETEVHPHLEHGITREWEGTSIDRIVEARAKVHEIKRANQASGKTEKIAKPRKPSKPPT